jgi:predicted protein tyrosine phosphatase
VSVGKQAKQCVNAIVCHNAIVCRKQHCKNPYLAQTNATSSRLFDFRAKSPRHPRMIAHRMIGRSTALPTG